MNKSESAYHHVYLYLIPPKANNVVCSILSHFYFGAQAYTLANREHGSGIKYQIMNEFLLTYICVKHGFVAAV